MPFLCLLIVYLTFVWGKKAGKAVFGCTLNFHIGKYFFIISRAYNCTSNTSVILFEMQSFGNDPIKTAVF